MPTNLKDLRSRIKSVKNTQQITKAMKVVSAAKFGRAQVAVVNSRPYAKELSVLVKKLSYFVRGGSAIPLLTHNTSKNALLVVASSERGLCGGYNSNIVKYAQSVLDELKNEGYKVSVSCIGKKAFHSLIRKNNVSNSASDNSDKTKLISEDEYIDSPASLFSADFTLLTSPFEKEMNQSIESFSEAVSTLYSTEKIGKVVLVYSDFQSAMAQEPMSETILPLSADTIVQEAEQQSKAEAESSDDGEPLFEPDRDEILFSVLPRYMRSRILHMLLEARASEYGARMTAMDNATRNAKEMEKKLQITYQRARQAAITNELIEIISGAEAL